MNYKGRHPDDLPIVDYAFLVDQRVNIIKDKSLDEALIALVPERKREAVKQEYNRWHNKQGEGE